MWREPIRSADCNCDFFNTNTVLPTREAKTSQHQNSIHSDKSSKKDSQEKKSVKKVLAASSSRKNIQEYKNNSKPEKKKEVKRKDDKTPTQQVNKTPILQQVKTQHRVIVRQELPMTVVKPVMTVRTVRYPKPVILQKQIPTASEYFVGLPVSKKNLYIEGSTISKMAKDQLEVTPETGTTDLIRQSSMNNIAIKEYSLRKECLRRSESEKYMYGSMRTYMESPESEKKILFKTQIKAYKAKSLKDLVHYKNFQDLKPKSTLSSGYNKSDVSYFSDVIETFNIGRGSVKHIENLNIKKS